MKKVAGLVALAAILGGCVSGTRSAGPAAYGENWITSEAEAGQTAGAEKTASGLIFISRKAGTGAQPSVTDRVTVHYESRLLDGTVFDSSIQRGIPATFPLNGMIPCWTEGVSKMRTGGKATLVCPSNIAYGDRGSPPHIQPGTTLIFEVELLEVAISANTKVPSANSFVEVIDDEFEARVEFRGPEEAYPRQGDERYKRLMRGERADTFNLRSWLDKKTRRVEHQVYVRNTYRAYGWRIWRRAAASGGSTLEFVNIHANVSCGLDPCYYFETFGVSVPDSVLRKHRAAGFGFKAKAKSGDSLIIQVPPRLIAAQLGAIERYRKK